MPDALRMKPGAGRRAAPPVRSKRQELPPTGMDASTTEVRDTLAGEARDVNGEERGPKWLRKRYPPKKAGGAARVDVF